uniref:Transferrin receptor-like dimerisation domain-containing protein n=1 Tax=Oncorhynchus tshawytscha TaxID=74940 RepID=A0AAZ3PUH0_ONCTS
MNIHTSNQVTRIYNVIGRIPGTVETGTSVRSVEKLLSKGLWTIEWIEWSYGHTGHHNGYCSHLQAQSGYSKSLTTIHDLTPADACQVQKTLVCSALHLSLCPEEGEEEVSLYESWHKQDNWTDDSGRARHTKNRKTARYSSYPVYHSVYETFELLRAVAEVRRCLTFLLADSQLLSLDKHCDALETYRVSFGKRKQHTQTFTYRHSFCMPHQVQYSTLILHSVLCNTLDVIASYLLFPLFRHLIFTPSSHNKYTGESFPGIYDVLFDVEHAVNPKQAWEEVRRHILSHPAYHSVVSSLKQSHHPPCLTQV